MSLRNGMSHEGAGRKGGKVARVHITKLGQRVRRLNAAKRREEKCVEEVAETAPPAPLPRWLAGDVSGLPKAPPGRKTP